MKHIDTTNLLLRGGTGSLEGSSGLILILPSTTVCNNFRTTAATASSTDLPDPADATDATAQFYWLEQARRFRCKYRKIL